MDFFGLFKKKMPGGVRLSHPKDGKFVYQVDNKRFTLNYKNGRLEGPYKEEFVDTKGNCYECRVGMYQNGEKEGTEDRYVHGNLISTVTYRNGHVDGEAEENHPGSSVFETGYMTEQGRQGRWYVYDGARQKCGFSEWKDGQQHGAQRQLLSEKQCKCHNLPEIKNGYADYQCENDWIVGEVKKFREDGSLFCTMEYNDPEQEFERNWPHGKYKEFYPNGQLAFETTYHHGSYVGQYTKYDENGNVTEHGDVKNMREEKKTSEETKVKSDKKGKSASSSKGLCEILEQHYQKEPNVSDVKKVESTKSLQVDVPKQPVVINPLAKKLGLTER